VKLLFVIIQLKCGWHILDAGA